MTDRYDRQILLFGEAGHHAIRSTKAVVVGTGGTGSHVIQQLAYLGVESMGLIDHDHADITSGNRLIGSRPADVASRRPKVDIVAALVEAINPAATVSTIPMSLISEPGFSAIVDADFVFGCVDRDSIRLVLNELCQAYKKPYMDLATDVEADSAHNFGGRVIYSVDGEGCVYCRGELDLEWVDADFSSATRRRDDEAIYGVPRSALRTGGPSVVSLNGVVASLAVTEFMVARTGLRRPAKQLTYMGAWGNVLADKTIPDVDCYYCKGIHGQGDKADVQRYIRDGWGEKLTIWSRS